ncbi:SepM family pheromone-processing serine protease [Paenibacillus massiliensis]|uniref:SepM family pheromone-processing serine protease n=1 Tax=Paenibacillus massiliensis TaxID=225917 RepID=UPI00046E8325|nr:SepM family pheromone-processing serine protease [Paenibacillus massiliensis]
MQQNRRNGLYWLLYLLSIAILAYVLVYMPIPYLIYKPGTAEEVKPMVTVQNGDPSESGSFMMTTVSASYANVILLALSAFDRDAEIQDKDSRLQGRSEAEYAAQQIYLMDSSQSSAIEAAYHHAEVAYQIVPNHVVVMKLLPDADRDLLPGDQLLEVEDKAIQDHAQLRGLLEGKRAGDTLSFKLLRDGEVLSREVTLIPITDSDTGQQRVGLGVSLATVQKIKPDNPDHAISFASTNVGGPSAGLIFTLEIYNQLTPGDLSKGYRIAGTGTIDQDGNVGEIGGIVHKIVAADRKGADIFFVPEGNYEAALGKAQAIDTRMELVPVRTLQDALDYLDAKAVKSES